MMSIESGYLNNFSPCDSLRHPKNRRVMDIMLDVVNGYNSVDGGILRETVIIEGMGTFLKQADCYDETGYFVSLRASRFGSGSVEATVRAIEEVLERLPREAELPVRRVIRESNIEGTGHTLVIVNNIHSIGG
jgi:hypothetical protein